MNSYLKSFLHGVVFFLGFSTTAVLAVTIPAFWTSGETISASRLNEMVTAIHELQTRVFGTTITQSSDTEYQASTDGFLTATCNTGAYFQILTGSSSPPTLVRAFIENQASSANHGTATIPVKRGDFYRVSRTGGCTPTVHWTPNGS